MLAFFTKHRVLCMTADGLEDFTEKFVGYDESKEGEVWSCTKLFSESALYKPIKKVFSLKEDSPQVSGRLRLPRWY